MAWPSRWIQAWTWIPRSPLATAHDPPGSTRYWNTMRWCTVDGPGDFTDPTFRTAIMLEYILHIGHAYNVAGLSIINLNWLAIHYQQGTNYYYDIEQFSNLITSNPVLPDQCSVCVKLYSGAGGRRGQGRTFLSNVPRYLTNQNYLNDVGLATYEELMNLLVTPFTVGPNTVTPCLPSYANKTLLQIDTIQCRSHLSMILRRSRSPAVPFPPPYRPPFPPPP